MVSALACLHRSPHFSVCYGSRLQQLLESIAAARPRVALLGPTWGSGSAVVMPCLWNLRSDCTKLGSFHHNAANCRSIFGHGTVWWLSDKLRSRLTTEEWVCLAKRAPSQAAVDVQWGAGMDAWVLHSSSALGSRACEQAVFDIWHVVAEGR